MRAGETEVDTVADQEHPKKCVIDVAFSLLSIRSADMCFGLVVKLLQHPVCQLELSFGTRSEPILDLIDFLDGPDTGFG